MRILTKRGNSVTTTAEMPSTVEMGLCFRQLIMSFTILSSLRWIALVQTVFSGLPRIGSHGYCCDSNGKPVWMELNTFKPWLVRPAIGSFRSTGRAERLHCCSPQGNRSAHV